VAQKMEQAVGAEMKSLFLDSHVVIWLYRGEVQRFSRVAKDRIEKHALVISPAVKLELAYLHEIGRVNDPAEVIIEDLANRIGLELKSEDFVNISNRALGLSWTRDVFDRLIVAHAALEASTLVSKDQTIRKHYSHAVW
jgi:PIN domain nuclease of toxin-antitoxin system